MSKKKDDLDLWYLAEQISNQNFSHLFDTQEDISKDQITIPEELCYVTKLNDQNILYGFHGECRVIGFQKIESDKNEIKLFINHLGNNYILEMNEKKYSDFDWKIVETSENDMLLKDCFYPFDIRINILPRQSIQDQGNLQRYITNFIKDNHADVFQAELEFNCNLNEDVKRALIKEHKFNLYFFEHFKGENNSDKLSFLLYYCFQNKKEKGKKEHLYYECNANIIYTKITIYEMKQVGLFEYMNNNRIFNFIKLEKYNFVVNQKLSDIPGQNRNAVKNKYIDFFINIKEDSRFVKDIFIDDHMIGTIDKYINAKLLFFNQKCIILQINDKIIKLEKCEFNYYFNKNGYHLNLKEIEKNKNNFKTSHVIEIDIPLKLKKRPEIIELEVKKDMTQIDYVNQYLNGIKKLQENILSIQKKTIRNTLNFDKIERFICMLEEINEADKIFINIDDFQLDDQNKFLEIFISSDDDMLQIKKWISESKEQGFDSNSQPVLLKEEGKIRKNNVKLSFNRLDRQILHIDIIGVNLRKIS